MKYLGILSALPFLALTAAAQEAPRERPPIIDMHLHAYSLTQFGGGQVTICPGDQGKSFLAHDPRQEPTLSKLESCPQPLTTPASDEALLHETLALLEKYNIRAVTSGPPDIVRRWHAAAPNRILPAVLLVDVSSTTPDELRELFTTEKFSVLGEVAVQYFGLSPSGPKLEPYLALAEELDVPVGIHIGPGAADAPYTGAPAYRGRLSNPLLLEEALLRHPKLRLYVMHAGWPMLDQMVNLLYTHPQVYADISALNWYLPRREFHRYLRRLVEAGFDKRILFGSNQNLWPQLIEVAIESIETADFLTAEQKRDIFYNNAVRFLRLDQKEQ